jgi:hypothetical protein
MRGKAQYYLGQVVGAGGQRYWRLLVRRNGVVSYAKMLDRVDRMTAEELSAVRLQYGIRESRKEQKVREIRKQAELERRFTVGKI